MLLNKNEFKTDIINGSTKNMERREWNLKHQSLKTIELIDAPGFDFCDIKDPENIFSQINSSELILFTITGDINRNEVSRINSFIKNGKKITEDNISKLVNLTENHELSELVDNCLAKNKKKTIGILNENNFNDEDCIIITKIFLNKSKNPVPITNLQSLGFT